LEGLKPEEEANLAIGMIDACVHICADSIRDREIEEEKLLELVRERIMFDRRLRAGLQVEEAEIDAALKSGFRMATFMDRESPFNADPIPSRRRLSKRAGTMQGLPTFYQAPEDLRRVRPPSSPTARLDPRALLTTKVLIDAQRIRSALDRINDPSRGSRAPRGSPRPSGLCHRPGPSEGGQDLNIEPD
jgi:hypothetical protein